MIIYQINSSTKHHFLGLANWNDTQFIHLGGEKYLDSWHPLTVELVQLEDASMGDFLGLSGGNIVFSEKAMEALLPLIEKYVEFLPLKLEDHIYYLINVIDIVDCLDYSRAKITRFKSGNVESIPQYAFKTDCIGERVIFKIPERLFGLIFVSDTFKRWVDDNRLHGLEFRQVWEE